MIYLHNVQWLPKKYRNDKTFSAIILKILNFETWIRKTLTKRQGTIVSISTVELIQMRIK